MRKGGVETRGQRQGMRVHSRRKAGRQEGAGVFIHSFIQLFIQAQHGRYYLQSERILLSGAKTKGSRGLYNFQQNFTFDSYHNNFHHNNLHIPQQKDYISLGGIQIQ
jgi:hypothetical protein